MKIPSIPHPAPRLPAHPSLAVVGQGGGGGGGGHGWEAWPQRLRRPLLGSWCAGSVTAICSWDPSLPGSCAGFRTASTRLHKFRTVHVKSGEAGGSPSTESTTTPDEDTLRQDLETAIEEEDYARAARLRDELRVLAEDSRCAVLAANARFYGAFKNGDLVAMRSAWAQGDHVCVVHPSAGRISGHDMVMQSWEMVCGADHEFPLQIDLDGVEVHVRGDLGYVTCLELVKARGSSGWGKQMATNVFERVDGKWFMCIHHASHFEE